MLTTVFWLLQKLSPYNFDMIYNYTIKMTVQPWFKCWLNAAQLSVWRMLN